MKKRFVGYLMITVIVLTFFCCAVAFGTKVRGEEVPKYEIYSVRAGDTLWTIAKKYVSKDKDIRKYIYEIMKENDLQTAALVPGQVLNIPLNQ